MTTTDTKCELKVMTFNVKVGSSEDGPDHWRHRRRIFMDLLRQYAHELICTQEGLAFQLEAIKSEFRGLDHVGVGRYHGVEVGREHESGDGERCAIFYNTSKFELLEHGTFWLSDTPEVPGSMSWGNDLARIVTWVYLMVRTTKIRFYAFNTHFHWGEHFQKQAALLLSERIQSIAQEDPVVLFGDFNCLPETEPWKILTGQIGNKHNDDCALSDCWRVLDKPEEKGGTSHSFTGKPEGRIDWILTSRQFNVRTIERLEYHQAGRYPSDHFPVVATLEL